jgi:hypothetical protein
MYIKYITCSSIDIECTLFCLFSVNTYSRASKLRTCYKMILMYLLVIFY